MSRLFGDDFITQKYLRRYPDSRRARSWAGNKVHIQTENGVWRIGGYGYTYAGNSDAWIVPFEQAVRQIDHCGPEKMGRFIRASTPSPQTSNDLTYHCDVCSVPGYGDAPCSPHCDRAAQEGAKKTDPNPPTQTESCE